jgi:hypothetical protein
MQTLRFVLRHRWLEARLASARFAEQMIILVAIVCVALSLAGRFAAFLLGSHAEKTVPTE